MAIRVVVAEDHRMVRELLVEVLTREAGITVVGQASNGFEAIEVAQARRPDLLVLDVSLPGLDGIEVARRLKKSQPEVKLLASSIHSEKNVVQAMLRAGADGYLLKTSAMTELVDAIRAVAQGQVYLSPEVAREQRER